jgi:hypothetical protein
MPCLGHLSFGVSSEREHPFQFPHGPPQWALHSGVSGCSAARFPELTTPSLGAIAWRAWAWVVFSVLGWFLRRISF